MSRSWSRIVIALTGLALVAASPDSAYPGRAEVAALDLASDGQGSYEPATGANVRFLDGNRWTDTDSFQLGFDKRSTRTLQLRVPSLGIDRTCTGVNFQVAGRGSGEQFLQFTLLGESGTARASLYCEHRNGGDVLWVHWPHIDDYYDPAGCATITKLDLISSPGGRYRFASANCSASVSRPRGPGYAPIHAAPLRVSFELVAEVIGDSGS